MSELITSLNSLLSSFESIFKTYRKHIRYFFITLSVLSFGFIFVPDSVKFTGEQSMNLLWILLFMPIFAKVIGISLIHSMMPLRKEIGILMGTLALVHGIGYLIPYPTYIFTDNFWTERSYAMSFGFIALLLTLSLLFTSNTWSIQLLGKKWKMLHRLVYIIIILTVIHVVALKFSRHFEGGGVILLGVYFFGKILEWRGISFASKKTYPKGQKWLCVPCGYIYDPAFGDEDSGIVPGTEFSDLPDDWQCRVCGVKKSDFVPLGKDTEGKKYTGKVLEKKYLNPTTLELTIELNEVLESTPGQFASFLWEDESGTFTRSYSLTKHDGEKLSFLIKLNPIGRGSRILSDISQDTIIRIKGIFGKFILQNSQNPKVFIATGTGLAPIYNMITHIQPEIKKSLYFSVTTHDELFYRAELSSIQNLDLKIHVTRESVIGLETGRVDIDSIEASPDTEWYLCGNPKMVSEAKEKLSEKGYQKIYTEAF